MEDYIEISLFQVEINGGSRSDFFLEDIYPASGSLGHTGSGGVDKEPFYDTDSFTFQIDENSGTVYLLEDIPVVIGTLYNGVDTLPGIKPGVVVEITVNTDDDLQILPETAADFRLTSETLLFAGAKEFDGVYYISEATHVIQQEADGSLDRPIVLGALYNGGDAAAPPHLEAGIVVEITVNPDREDDVFLFVPAEELAAEEDGDAADTSSFQVQIRFEPLPSAGPPPRADLAADLAEDSFLFVPEVADDVLLGF